MRIAAGGDLVYILLRTLAATLAPLGPGVTKAVRNGPHAFVSPVTQPD